MGCVVFRGFLSSLTMEFFYFFAQFAFKLLEMWGTSLRWSDLVIIPVCSNTCREGTGVLMIGSRGLATLCLQNFILQKKCIFNSSQECSQIQNTSFTGL